MNGIFPVNDQHLKRQPYFIDRLNTYCAAGYLMQQSGADAIARTIHETQNFSYLFDIRHPELINWVLKSGLTLQELALIQPTYAGDWPAAIMEFHYNNTGTDTDEYLEIHESSGQPGGMPGFNRALLFDGNGNLYKTLLKADMMNLPNGVGYYYNFSSLENFSDLGRIVLLGSNFFSQLDTISITTYNDMAVDVKDFFYSNYMPVANRHFSAGENDNTSAGTSLTYCGFYSDPNWTLQSIAATQGYPNPCTILPIHLTNFRCVLAGQKVNIEWETLSENNSKSFIIERSKNGINFEQIGKLQSAGNSNVLRKYSFTDNNPDYINHYRLKQIDIDGKFSYSKILYVKVAQISPIRMEKITANSIQLQVSTEQLQIKALTLYDFAGRKIKQFEAKTGFQTLNVAAVPAGSYLLQLSTITGLVYNLQFVK